MPAKKLGPFVCVCLGKRGGGGETKGGCRFGFHFTPPPYGVMLVADFVLFTWVPPPRIDTPDFGFDIFGDAATVSNASAPMAQLIFHALDIDVPADVETVVHPAFSGFFFFFFFFFFFWVWSWVCVGLGVR